MKLLFALLTCSAAFPHCLDADTGGGSGGGAAPEFTPPSVDAPPADSAGLTQDQGGIHGDPSGVEAPLQDGAKDHLPSAAAASQTPPPAQETRKPVMPDDVKEAITELIVDVIAKQEAAKAQAAVPAGGLGSPAAAIEARFTGKALTGDQHEAIGVVVAAAKTLALVIEEVAPAGREKSLAHTACEQVVQWANAAISRGPAA